MRLRRNGFLSEVVSPSRCLHGEGTGGASGRCLSATWTAPLFRSWTFPGRSVHVPHVVEEFREKASEVKHRFAGHLARLQRCSLPFVVLSLRDLAWWRRFLPNLYSCRSLSCTAQSCPVSLNSLFQEKSNILLQSVTQNVAFSCLTPTESLSLSSVSHLYVHRTCTVTYVMTVVRRSGYVFDCAADPALQEVVTDDDDWKSMHGMYL